MDSRGEAERNADASMFDTLFVVLAIAMVAYWFLWAAGIKLPGVGHEPFVGLRYRPNWTDPDDDRRAGDHP